MLNRSEVETRLGAALEQAYPKEMAEYRKKEAVRVRRETTAARAAERAKWARIERKYGLTQEAYRALYEAQRGLCGLCSEPLPFDQIEVDHDHESGRVRAMLHGRCNTALGQFGDSVEQLQRAIAYLERHRA